MRAASQAIADPATPIAATASPDLRLVGDAHAVGTAEFLDMRFELSEEREVLDCIRSRSPALPFAYVVTPNVDHLVRLQRMRSDLWPTYRRAWITLCDSRILGKLAANAGLTLPIVPGSDLTVRLFDEVVRPEDRIAIVGGDKASIARLIASRGLLDVVHYDPPMGFVRDPVEVNRAVAFIVGARARYTFLAVGSPQQEILAYRAARSGRARGVGLCVGASLDFLTGGQTRAPALVQRLALEWLYRLASDPMRLWRRYLVDGPAIFAIFKDWRRRPSEAA